VRFGLKQILEFFSKINNLQAFNGTSERFLPQIKQTSKIWSQRIRFKFILRVLSRTQFSYRTSKAPLQFLTFRSHQLSEQTLLRVLQLINIILTLHATRNTKNTQVTASTHDRVLYKIGKFYVYLYITLAQSYFDKIHLKRNIIYAHLTDSCWSTV
jgi:hypothetical protein